MNITVRIPADQNKLAIIGVIRELCNKIANISEEESTKNKFTIHLQKRNIRLTDNFQKQQNQINNIKNLIKLIDDNAQLLPRSNSAAETFRNRVKDNTIKNSELTIKALKDYLSEILIVSNTYSVVDVNKTWLGGLSTIEKVGLVILCALLLVAGIIPGLIAITVIIIAQLISHYKIINATKSNSTHTDSTFNKEIDHE